MVGGGCASTPRYGEMTAEELYGYAMEQYEEGRWSRAAEALERLTAFHPSFPRMAEARYYLARAYFGKGEYLTAVAEFRRVAERWPDHGLADDARLGICEAYFRLSPIPERDQTYTEQGILACDDVVRGYPGTETASRAGELRDSLRTKLAEKDFLNGEFYFRRHLYDSAIIYFQEAADGYPDTPVAPRALLRLVEIYRRLGYEEEESQARERLLRDYPDSPEARELEGSPPPADTAASPAPAVPDAPGAGVRWGARGG